MTKILQLILVFGFVSCWQATRQSKSTISESTRQNDVVNEYELASIYRDVDSDSLLAASADKSKLADFITNGTKIEEKEYGGGDCDGKFKRFVLDEDTLTIDKYDCGDYGFGNTGFVSNHDSLRYVREYKIEWFPGDEENEYNVSETIYEFTANKLTKRTRTKSIKDWKDFKIDDMNFAESRLPAQDECSKFKKALRDLSLKDKLTE
jgi:hypothetical protein